MLKANIRTKTNAIRKKPHHLIRILAYRTKLVLLKKSKFGPKEGM